MATEDEKRTEYRRRCDELGVGMVRAGLAAHAFPTQMQVSALEWLAEKDKNRTAEKFEPQGS